MQGGEDRVVEGDQAFNQPLLLGGRVRAAGVEAGLVGLQPLPEAVAQLRRGVLGERDGRQLRHRGEVAGSDHVHGSGDQGGGLAGARASLDEQRLREAAADGVARRLVFGRAHGPAPAGSTRTA